MARLNDGNRAGVCAQTANHLHPPSKAHTSHSSSHWLKAAMCLAHFRREHAAKPALAGMGVTGGSQASPYFIGRYNGLEMVTRGSA